MSKHIDDAVRHQIRTMRDAGNSYAAIESALGVPLSDVIKIVKGRTEPPASDKIRSDFGKFHSREPNETLRCCAQTEECATPSKISPRHQRQAARSLRTARWTFKRIGAHLGISPSSAHLFAGDIKIPRRQGNLSSKDTETVVKRKQRIAEARQMRMRGDKLEKIAETFDVTEGTASKWCKGIAPPINQKRAEIIAEAREMRLRGDTLEKIAAHFGVTHQTIANWTRDIPNPRGHTAVSKPTELTQNIEKAYQMSQSGMTLKAIGKFFGVNRSTIFRWVEWYRKEKITNEVLYFYTRDTYGMPIEVEREKVAPSGEIRIERQRL